MPANTTFGINTDSLRLRYHPNRNFDTRVRRRRPDADRQGRHRSVHRLDGRTDHDQSAVQLATVRQQPGGVTLIQPFPRRGFSDPFLRRDIPAAVVLTSSRRPQPCTNRRDEPMADARSRRRCSWCCSSTSRSRTRPSRWPRGARSTTTSRCARSASPARKDWQGLSRHRALDPVDRDPYTGAEKQITYAERFPHQYQQFKAQAAQTKSGTPLDYAPFLTEARRAELRAQNVYTVEQLAAIDGAGAEEPRPRRARDTRTTPMEYLAESQGRRAEPADGGRAGGAARAQRGARGGRQAARRARAASQRPRPTSTT